MYPWCPQIHNGELRSLTVVEIEAFAQPGTSLHDADGAVVIGRRRILGQELATHTLMVAFSVVVSDVFANKMSKVSLANNNEVIKAFVSNGLNETLSVRIAVRALRRNGNASDAAAGEEKFPLLREQGIAVVHQELSAAKKTSVGSQRLRTI